MGYVSMTNRNAKQGLSSGVAVAALMAAVIVAQPVWAEFAQDMPSATSAEDVSPVEAAPISIGDPLSLAIAEWDRLRRDTTPLVFTDISRFLAAHRGWPGEIALRKRAERAITAATPLADRTAFFNVFPPLTPAGEFRYAEALLQTGRGAEATRLVRDAWASDGLPSILEPELLAKFGSVLTPADHAARADRLIWSGQTAAASRLAPYLGPDDRALAEARLALRSNAFDAAQRVAVVPVALQNDPGLLADRAEWLRQGNDYNGARAVLANAVIAPGAVSDPLRWMQARLALAKAAQRDGQHDIAYRLAANANAWPLGRPLLDHSDAERDVYTDLQFIAGTLAMSQLGRPAAAVDHFQNYRAAAKAPQTQARGDYWAGRAAEAAGLKAQSALFLGRAGMHPDYYYGQLALERLDRPVRLRTVPLPVVSAPLRQGFASNELVRAARILGQRSDRQRQTQFLRALVETAETPEQLALVAELCPQLGRRDIGVMAARAARGDGELALIDSAFPKLPLDSSFDDRSWVMVHAITRQESRFDPTAVSSANARGLMQLMPATAAEQAGKLGVGYSAAQLNDERYNIMLGSAYYQRLLDRWNGSHLLAVASYNAGAGNVNKWVRANGDPRDGSVDVVNWVEAIPFSETRNYVQRVLENAVVYDLIRRPAVATTEPISNYLGKRTKG